jgi:hypothetical protein
MFESKVQAVMYTQSILMTIPGYTFMRRRCQWSLYRQADSLHKTAMRLECWQNC